MIWRQGKKEVSSNNLKWAIRKTINDSFKEKDEEYVTKLNVTSLNRIIKKLRQRMNECEDKMLESYEQFKYCKKLYDDTTAEDDKYFKK